LGRFEKQAAAFVVEKTADLDSLETGVRKSSSTTSSDKPLSR
jgi:hypothetical protein